MNDTDVINHIENETTGQPENWITLKDASDLLNISERHAWNIISRNGFQTKKILNKSRKKTYVLQSDIEKYHRNEEERKKLEALKPSSPSEKSEMSEQESLLEMSERDKTSLSERVLALSEREKPIKTLPALLVETIREQKKTTQALAIWKVTAIWIGLLAIVTTGTFALYLDDLNTRLSESNIALSESRRAISEREKALSEMSERVFMLSEREKEGLQKAVKLTLYAKDLENRLLLQNQEGLEVVPEDQNE